MKVVRVLVVAATFLSLAVIGHAATCDQYPGDTWIYGGITSRVKPNVLIIVDTSGSMSDPVLVLGQAYDSTLTYVGKYPLSRVYLQKKNKWEDTGLDINQITSSCGNLNPRQLLSDTGTYTGTPLTATNACGGKGTETYATGNWMNWYASDIRTDHREVKIEIARDVVKQIISDPKFKDLNFGVMIYNNGDGSPEQSQGARFFSYRIGKEDYITTIKDMEANFSDSKTNRQALLDAINTTTITADGFTPLAESLYEAGQYFKGGPSAFGNTIGLSGSPLSYTSPITASCQQNTIIFVTDGMPRFDNDPVLQTVCPPGKPGCGGDYDDDGKERNSSMHYMDDVAKYLYETDLLPDKKDKAGKPIAGFEHTINQQNVTTYTIGFGEVTADDAASTFLRQVADKDHGRGAYYPAANATALATAMYKILSNVVTVDTSYTAPVIPVSADNRTYISNRIYMSFFKPDNEKFWRGNLKKYGLSTKTNKANKDISNVVTDANGDVAVWIDLDDNAVDDFTGDDLKQSGITNGTFKAGSISFWSDSADGGVVDKGGAGSILLNGEPAKRKIYTYNGGTADLTNAANSLTTVTAAQLGVGSDTERISLISYLQGMDAYGAPAEKRKWILGDLLHSRPAIVSYGKLTGQESDCKANTKMLYTGGNDGMLHAIRDCDGSEAWAFIPPDLLPVLKEYPGKIHTYGVDSTPSVYIHDVNTIGKIEGKDKVLLFFGMRRGGGASSDSTKGAYYSLDVTNYDKPQYLGRIGTDPNVSGLDKMGESWGEPRIIRIKIGTELKVAAFVTGGYDNVNEDSRYGATQNFSGDGKVSLTDSGSGSIPSSGANPPKNPHGRALYLVELATLKGDVLTTKAPTVLWSVVPPATDTGLSYAFTGDVALLDTKGSGSYDRMYAADLGGNVWRFDIGGSDVSKWRGYKLFSINPDAGDTGRKFFFKPSVSLEAFATQPKQGLDAIIFLGSGDREHPLNRGVVDRIYALRDRGQITEKPLTEGDLTDVTEDTLQNPDDPGDVLKRLSSSYGWFIRLNERPGEKVLAPATVYDKIAYFTTYIPGNNSSSSSTSLVLSVGSKTLFVSKGLNILSNQRVTIENGSNRMNGTITDYTTETGALAVDITSVVGKGTFNSWQVGWGDPCIPAIGTSRLYAVNYATGEAVYNFDHDNDSTKVTNTRARSGGAVLMRNDRSKALGAGMASGLVVTVNSNGTIRGITGGGGSLPPLELKKGGSLVPIYWRQK